MSMTPYQLVWLGGYLLYLFGVYTPAIARYRRRQVTQTRSRGWDVAQDMLAFLGWQVIPLVYLLSPWLDFADYRLPAWAGWVGTILYAAAQFVLWRAYADLGRSWSPKIDLMEAQKLVTGGIYRVVRHPIYTGLLLWGLAQPLLLQNWVAGLSLLVTYLPLITVRVPREENMLAEAFGEEYREYARRTGRFFPRLSG